MLVDEEQRWKISHNFQRNTFFVSTAVIATIGIGQIIPSLRSAAAAEQQANAQSPQTGMRQDVSIRPGATIELGPNSMKAMGYVQSADQRRVLQNVGANRITDPLLKGRPDVNEHAHSPVPHRERVRFARQSQAATAEGQLVPPSTNVRQQNEAASLPLN